LPKLNSVVTSRVCARLSIICTLAAILLLAAAPIHGQSGEQAAKADGAPPRHRTAHEVLPARLGNTWRAAGEARQLSAESFAVVEGGPVYLEYGLQSLTARRYTNGQARVLVEAFAMRYPSGAHGLWTFNRGSLPPGRQEYHVGRYLVGISREHSREQSAASSEQVAVDAELFAAIQQHLSEGPFELSPLPTHLPEQHKIAESDKYLIGPEALTRLAAFADLKQVVNFTGGAEAVTADYHNGGGRMNLLIVEYHTPQLASAGFAQLKGHYDALDPQEQSRRLIKRVGNYIVEAVNIADAAAAQAVIGEIKYTTRVYWEGRRYTAIPLPFRPPDPALLQEARRTAQFLVTVFYGIGLMMVGAVTLGVFAGGGFFYWRRYQRRRLGLENAFSDAGGTIRLNLDNYLLPSKDSPAKLLGKND
jgi:hypothetical protein